MRVHGIWVDESQNLGSARCRRMIAWQEFDDGLMVGAVAGQKGERSFVVLPFLVRLDREVVALLWANGRDLLTNEIVHLSEFDSETRLGTVKGIAEVWRWNDRKAWGPFKALVLLEERRPELTEVGPGLLGVGTSDVPRWAGSVYSKTIGGVLRKGDVVPSMGPPTLSRDVLSM